LSSFFNTLCISDLWSADFQFFLFSTSFRHFFMKSTILLPLRTFFVSKIKKKIDNQKSADHKSKIPLQCMTIGGSEGAAPPSLPPTKNGGSDLSLHAIFLGGWQLVVAIGGSDGGIASLIATPIVTPSVIPNYFRPKLGEKITYI